MNKLIFDSIYDMPIKDFFEFNNEMSKIDKEDSLEISKCFVKHLYKLSIRELNQLTFKQLDDLLGALKNVGKASNDTLKFEREHKLNLTKPKNTIKIKGKRFKITTKINDSCIAQYIDFTSLVSKMATNPELVLGTLLIPFNEATGKFYDYNDGYDFEEHVQFLFENCSIEYSNEIIGFFLKGYLNSLKKTLISSKLKLMIPNKLMNRVLTKEQKQKTIGVIQTTIEEINKILNLTHTHGCVS